MTVWLLSILGVGVLDVLVLHFTENTRLHKTIKTVCSVVFVFVIIYPLPGLISGSLEFGGITFNYSTEIDSNLTDIVYENQKILLENAIESALKDDGFTADVKIEAEFINGEITVTYVTAKCEKYNVEVINKISEYIGISKEYIYIDVTG